MFYDDTRKQLIMEVGGRVGTTGSDDSAAAFGTRYQHALGRRVVFIVDAFVGWLEDSDVTYGSRFEVRLDF